MYKTTRDYDAIGILKTRITSRVFVAHTKEMGGRGKTGKNLGEKKLNQGEFFLLNEYPEKNPWR